MPLLSQPITLQDACFDYLAKNIEKFCSGKAHMSKESSQTNLSPLVYLPLSLKDTLLHRLEAPTVEQLQILTDHCTRKLPACVTRKFTESVDLLMAARKCKGLTNLSIINDDCGFTTHVSIVAFTNLCHLVIRGFHIGIDDRVLIQIGSYLHQLRYLDLLGFKFTESTPRNIWQLCPGRDKLGCPNLETLKLCNVRRDMGYLEVIDLVFFILDMPKICFIEHPFFYAALHKISEGKLLASRSLSINCLHVLSSDSGLSEIGKTVEYFGGRLLCLNIEKDYYSGVFETFSSDAASIVSNLPYLKHLSICQMLTKHSLDGCKDTLVSLALTNDAEGLTSSHVQHILKTFQALKYLFIDVLDDDWVEEVTNSAINPRFEPQYENVTKLQKVVIRNINLTTPTLEAILMSTDLEHASLEMCGLTNEVLHRVISRPAQGCSRHYHSPGFQKLRTLCLASCFEITDEYLCILLNECGVLQRLAADNCPLVDEQKMSDQIALLKSRNFNVKFDSQAYDYQCVEDFIPSDLLI